MGKPLQLMPLLIVVAARRVAVLIFTLHLQK